MVIRAQRKFRSATFAAIVAWLAPAVALACPQCAGRAGGGIAQGIMLASFVLFPFAISGVIFKIIRSEFKSTTEPSWQHHGIQREAE
jgi:hypothetical protein